MAQKDILVNDKKFKISYEFLNLDKKKTIIFLHGWGSNKEVMKIFKDNFKDFKHLYIDLPGFGRSSNDYVLTTKDYAKIIDTFLDLIEIEKEVIIAHSFGGKVGVLLNPKNLILLASAGIVLPKSFKVRAKIALFKLLKPFKIKSLRDKFISADAKGLSENMYETFKNVVDEDFREYFKNFKNRALVFGAYEDSAVKEEAVKLQADLLNSKNIMLSGDHYFFLDKKNREVIEKEVYKFLNLD